MSAWEEPADEVPPDRREMLPDWDERAIFDDLTDRGYYEPDPDDSDDTPAGG